MRWPTVAAGAAVVAAAAAVTVALAHPQASVAATLVRAAADGGAAVTLGLALVPALDGARHRAELIRRATVPLSIAGAVWLLAELARFIVAAAQTAGVAVGHLDVPTTVDFALSTAAGRTELFSVAAATAVCVAALVGPRLVPAHRGWALHVTIAALAAVDLAARPLTGHFAQSALGGFAVAVHTLAAALWCGVLAGLVLTIEHRGQWARVLPRFSALSLGCVVVLLIGGLTGALARLQAPAELYATGYGRVLTAKVVVTVVLVALGWRNRTMWLPAARSHRATAVVSRSRSLTELAIMAVALVLAAGLAVTG